MNTTQLKRIIAHAIPCGLDRVSDTDHERLVTALTPLLFTLRHQADSALLADLKAQGLPILDCTMVTRDEPPAQPAPVYSEEQLGKIAEEITRYFFPAGFFGDENNSAEGHRGEADEAILVILKRHQPAPQVGDGKTKEDGK